MPFPGGVLSVPVDLGNNVEQQGPVQGAPPPPFPGLLMHLQIKYLKATKGHWIRKTRLDDSNTFITSSIGTNMASTKAEDATGTAPADDKTSSQHHEHEVVVTTDATPLDDRTTWQIIREDRVIILFAICANFGPLLFGFFGYDGLAPCPLLPATSPNPLGPAAP
jgi:hypothetical protein